MPKTRTVQPMAVVLPADLEERLAAHCAEWGERPSQVIADAVELHLDECGALIDEDVLNTAGALAVLS